MKNRSEQEHFMLLRVDVDAKEERGLKDNK